MTILKRDNYKKDLESGILGLSKTKRKDFKKNLLEGK